MNDSKTKKIKPKSVGRVLAFQALYREELNPQESTIENWEELYDYYSQETQLTLSDKDRIIALAYARCLFEGTTDRRPQIDQLLNKALDKRTLKHTTIVDRNILRVAAYEMRFIKTAKAIVISEAIELGKKFGERNSQAFLNGVLDQVDNIPLNNAATIIVESTSSSSDK